MFAGIKHQCLSFTVVILLGVLLWGNLVPAVHAQPDQLSTPIVPIQTDFALTTEERKLIIDQLLASPQVEERRSQRLRVLNLTIAPLEKEAEAEPSQRRLASAVVFNYSLGNTSRFLVDTASGEVIGEEVLPGRPQPSRSEVQEALRIIQASPELAPLLQAGNVVEGGFAVDAPPGSPSNNRYIQFQLLSSDRNTLQQVIYVDLTSNNIASSSSNFQ